MFPISSIWYQACDNCNQLMQTPLEGQINTDVLIIGGGLAGVLCAYKLKERGIPYLLVEGTRIGSGMTGNTTAKITAQHGLLYNKLLGDYGPEAARNYYDINMRARTQYETLATQFPCDFEKKTAFTYSVSDRRKIENEAYAYEKLGIKPLVTDSAPLPFAVAGVIGMEDQAQFNPLKFLYGIASDLDIYENTYVHRLEDDTAYTAHGSIKAKAIIIATHFPFVNVPGLYFLKMYQHRSYVIALENGPQLDGMYVDEDKKGHSFRNYKDFLLLGGGDHKTGKEGGMYDELRSLAHTAYPGCREAYAWAAQDCMTLDAVPYIGVHRKAKSHVYVATGFNKWGMTGSMAAAIVLSDLIAGGKSEYEKLFSPQRSMLQPQLFANGANALVNILHFGKRCPHLGCALRWNEVEQSWDCPCHGSRFEKNGHLIDNPAKRGFFVE